MTPSRPDAEQAFSPADRRPRSRPGFSSLAGMAGELPGARQQPAFSTSKIADRCSSALRAKIGRGRHIVHLGSSGVDAELMAAAVEPLHPFDDLVAGHGDDEAQQRFQKRDGRYRGRKELRRVDG
jgi:hypothetical protein